MSTTSSSTPVVWSEKHHKVEAEGGSVTVVTFDNSKTTRLNEEQLDALLGVLGVDVD
jgi:hypothetical protein